MHKPVPITTRQISSPNTQAEEQPTIPSLHQRLMSQISSFTQNVFKDAQKISAGAEAESRQNQKFQQLLESAAGRTGTGSQSFQKTEYKLRNQMPSDIKIVSVRTNDDELEKMKRIAQALLPAFERVMKRASRLSMIPERLDAQIIIGRARVAARRVTQVGDVDGNGYADYIVANPSAQNNSGSIRLYLMSKGRKFLYTRDLIPGKHGFDEEPLQGGHRFGSAVTHLPGINGTGVYIAVFAPGDGDQGSVYVIKLSRTGDVLKHCKSHGKSSLHQETKYGSWTSMNNASLPKLEVLKDVSNIVFEAADGEVLAMLKVDSKRDSQFLRMIEREHVLPTMKLSLDEPEDPVRHRGSGTRDLPCIFNETHCACDSIEEPKGSHLQSSGVDKSGRHLCSRTEKKTSVSCRCKGKRVCMRTKGLTDVFVAEENTDNGQMFCRKDRAMHIHIDPIDNQPKNLESIRKVQKLDIFNDTHCVCARKMEQSTQCLHLTHETMGLAMYCSRRKCNRGINEFGCNALGNAYCERKMEHENKWVFDGKVLNREHLVYCHKAFKPTEKNRLLFYLN